LEPCRRFAALLRKHGGQIALNSDAHFAKDVGRSEGAREVLTEAGISLEQVVNSSGEKVQHLLENRKERINKSGT
jgi:histidinol phosphatase-like PHP family hydrolase